MDYPFENLDPERFQLFCQALIVRQYPNLQCLPVGQPDGGRDAIRLESSQGNTKEFVVYQVKFRRGPALSGQDAFDWLAAALEDERPKIEALLTRGAREYVLMTNVQGSSHLDVGAIDKTQDLLGDLPVPSMCWWRNDLSRRLDSAWDLKWAYPELFTGVDFIRALAESGLSEDRERRTGTIKAFLRDQYEREADVRFKQVELQNRLLDLFIDVPLLSPERFAHTPRHQRAWTAFRRVRANVGKATGDEDAALLESEDRRSVGAASFFLHPASQEGMPLVVLEGAPGQGKSTITQYLSQVHRMRLLGRVHDLQGVPEHHRSQPVRLPLRVDLRDYAGWIARKSPFASEAARADAPADWNRGLESFLAALITDRAGGVVFTPADLHAILRISAVLIVLDGLDEVAEIARRAEVVEEIRRGVGRLSEVAASLQVIVTSRPAVFANSPGLSEEEYPYFRLGAVTRPLIDEYANKWLAARRLAKLDADEVRTILRDKLTQPHLRDLSRNPMQLAILLSLIHTRGVSLPDKRTALYDAYVELFFSREAEKSSVVRNHRDLLIDLHRYLGYQLQAEAEAGNEAGSITTDRLQETVRAYLAAEGHPTSVAEELFAGVVERVVALVSRVEGTFEFEVQPLREYFAARFLYDTAPYSPPGRERSGTKPDRFDAVASNFYWLNVARFFAGCFSKGELADLVERLRQLLRHPDLRRTSHPRVLAWTLLTDWVFAQNPHAAATALEVILEGNGFRHIGAMRLASGRSNHLGPIPEQCGQSQLVRAAYDIATGAAPGDLRREVSHLMRVNNPRQIFDTWREDLAGAPKPLFGKLLQVGLGAGLFRFVTLEDLESVLVDKVNEPLARALYKASRFDLLASVPELVSFGLQAILDREVSLVLAGPNPAMNSLEFLAQATWPGRYALALRAATPLPLKEVWTVGQPYSIPIWKPDREEPDGDVALQRAREVAERVLAEAERSAQEWATSLTPWANIVSSIESEYGRCRLAVDLASCGAGIRSHDETCGDADDLFDEGIQLVRRVRYARLRAGNLAWWVQQLSRAKGEAEASLALTLLMTWASARTLVRAAEPISHALEVLSPERKESLRLALEERAGGFEYFQMPRGSVVRIDVDSLPERLPTLFVVALGSRAVERVRADLYKRYLADYAGNDPFVLHFCMGCAIDLLRDRERVREALGVIERAYAAGVSLGANGVRPFTARRMSAEAVRRIADEPERYPIALLAASDTKARQLAARRVRRVAEVAEHEAWFRG